VIADLVQGRRRPAPDGPDVSRFEPAPEPARYEAPRCWIDPDPSKTWVKQALRAFDIATNQARALRKRALIDDFRSAAHRGSYWGITTSVADYQLADALPVSPEATRYLSSTRTRLNPFTDAEQCRLINGGYALCDAAMRKYVIAGAGPVPRWPYPQFSLDRPIAPAETVAAAAGGYESP